MSDKKKVKVATSMDRALGSLQDLHEERVNDEKAAAEKAVQDKKNAEEAAARAAKEAEEAKVRAKRQEEIDAVKGLAASEREARVKAEAAAAAERNRAAASLEFRRTSHEEELEREKRKRVFPPWAIAGAVIAVLVVGGLFLFGVFESKKAQDLEAQANKAEQHLADLKAQREQKAKELAEANEKLAQAKDDAERARLQKEKDRKQKELDDAAAAEAKAKSDEAAKLAAACQRAKDRVAAERKGGVHVDENDTKTALGGLQNAGDTQAEKDVKRFCNP